MTSQRLLAQFVDESGEKIGTPLDIPIDVNVEKLQLICNAVQDETTDVPFLFFVGDHEISASLQKTLELDPAFQTESVVEIRCVPQAVYRVKAVTRCTSSLPGHTEPVICVAFNCNGRRLASGSGDTTVRMWDVSTETPLYTCKAHKHWVLVIAWSPDGKRLASGDKQGSVCVWDGTNGNQIGKTLTGHKQWITSLAWEPLHM